MAKLYSMAIHGPSLYIVRRLGKGGAAQLGDLPVERLKGFNCVVGAWHIAITYWPQLPDYFLCCLWDGEL